jgi:hypothetical protein
MENDPPHPPILSRAARKCARDALNSPRFGHQQLLRPGRAG